MEEKPITEKESLRLIQQMIGIAKREQKDDGKGWIIWGWMLFLASVFTYINLQAKWVSVFFFWNAFGLLAGVLLLVEIVRFFWLKKPARVKTYTRDLFSRLNVGFFLFLLLIIFSINLGVSPEKGFALLIGLYSFWILVYGTALDFKPSIIAAYLSWGFAFAGLFVVAGRFDLTMILHGTAVLIGYIIPGHLANREFNVLRRKDKAIASV